MKSSLQGRSKVASKGSFPGGAVKPDSFREASVFTLTAIVAGFFIEWITAGAGIDVPRWPVNLMFLVACAVLILAVALRFRQHPLVAWLGGIPVGLCLVFGLAFLAMLGGVIPQDTEGGATLFARLRLNNIFSSWPFAAVSLLFLGNLGLALVWKIVPFKVSNLQFIFFHGGFWLALSCGLLGTSDLQRLAIPVNEGQENNEAYDPEGRVAVKMPFSIYLKSFNLEEYVPQIALYDPEYDRVIPDLSSVTPDVRKGTSIRWKGGLQVTVLDYLPDAREAGSNGNPVPATGKEGVAFAKVRIENEGTVKEQWISTAKPGQMPAFAPVGRYFLIMASGSPKAFRSDVMLSIPGGERKTTVLEVNKPADFAGWRLYQMGYDEKAGRWSQLSIVEAVRDPWLPAVYCGFFMIMAGNLLFFWKGVKKMEEA